MSDATAASERIAAIDVHGHVGTCVGSGSDLTDRLQSGSAAEVVERAARSAVVLTIVSPLSAFFPRGRGDAEAGNEESLSALGGVPGLMFWAVANPLQPATFAQAARLMRHPRCAGIKIHPEEHVYPVREHGRALFELADRLGAVLITHSGEPNSLPEDFVPFADEFPGVRLVLAHLGCGHDRDPSHQVRAAAACRHGNVFIDTSSARNVMPGLLEWAAAEIGAERLLFGTDTPLYHVPMQRARIEGADLPNAAKRKILRDNALRVLADRIGGAIEVASPHGGPSIVRGEQARQESPEGE